MTPRFGGQFGLLACDRCGYRYEHPGQECPYCKKGARDPRQLLLWGPESAGVLLEDPDDRPYVWDLPH